MNDPLQDVFDEAILAAFDLPGPGESKTICTFFKTLAPCSQSDAVSDDKSLTLVEEFLETTSKKKAFQIAEEISKEYPDLKNSEIQVGKVVALFP